MATAFRTIGLIGRLRCEETANTIENIVTHLQQRNLSVVLDAQTASVLPNSGHYQTQTKDALGKHCDMVIVVGGDGSLLSAAHAVFMHNTPLLGVNRGHLGFLTDLHPQQFADELDRILDGHYIQEQRFLLQVQITDNTKTQTHCDAALNDVVLSPGKIAQLIDFDIFVDDELMCHNRADGLIIATPTGSTAYALSAGGPILHPQLDAIVLVPMFPHTLSSRPIVISGSSQIRIVIDRRCEAEPNLSIDGQHRIPVSRQGHIIIEKHPSKVQLIHPKHYQYYATLRQKLGWESKPRRSQR